MLNLILLAGLLLLLNIALVLLHKHLCKRLPPDDPDSDYYDENGNHIYYDRRLIAHLEKEKQKEIQQ